MKYLIACLIILSLGFVEGKVVVYEAEASEPFVPVVRETAPESTEVVEVAIDVKQAVINEFGANSVMVEIARCESNFRQFDENGEPIKSYYGTNDIGVFQINGIHQETLVKLGLDRNKLEDNIKFARYLYDKNGVRDWIASKECWQ